MSDKRMEWLISLFAEWCGEQGFTHAEISSADEMLNSALDLDDYQRDWLEGYCAVWDTVERG